VNLETADLAIATPHLAMTYSLVPWDQAILGFAVAQISTLTLADAMRAQGDFERFEHWRDEESVRLVSCRLDHERLRESMFLEARGFRFIELVYQPRFADVQAIPDADYGIEIRAATERDEPEIAEIAATAFTTGRYLLDWRLGPESNGLRYAAWIRNSFANPAHRVLKATENGRIVAFFVVETHPGGTCYWHLTAVAEGHRGRGVGRRVWHAMLMLHKADGVAEVETLVSGHNLPVLNLYAALGFRLRRAQMTFHWLRES
jgi:ribosomal protein S18 acetylase RimI-like enzyme